MLAEARTVQNLVAEGGLVLEEAVEVVLHLGPRKMVPMQSNMAEAVEGLVVI